MNAGVPALEARIKAAITLAGQKRLNGDLQGARELALSVLAIDEEHVEARRLLGELLAELQRPAAPPPAAEVPAEAPAPPEAPAWPSMVAAPASTHPPSESLTAPARPGVRHAPARSPSRRASPARTVAMVGGVVVVAAGALLAASGFLRSDPQVGASPSPPATLPTAVPAVAEPTPGDQPAARPVDPEILRQAQALLVRGDYAEAQRAVNDGLRLNPSDPGLRGLQRRIQADARRAADEAAAGIREARALAEKARAAELAGRLFQQARDLEVDAARAYERQLWTDALAKGLAAARAYKEAQGQADAEATRLQFEQARARAAEAEQARRTAEAAATPAAAANPAETDRAAIVAVIKGYTAAMQAKDLAGLKTLWPGLAGAQEAKVRSGFEFAKSLRVQIDVTGVQIANGAAVVTCQRKDTVVTLEGRTVQSDRAAVIRLVKNPHGWSIAAIQ
jgi:hypothetical protein